MQKQNGSNTKTEIGPFVSLLYGGIAGSTAKTVIAPFDRVKIHFQIAHPELTEYRGNPIILHRYNHSNRKTIRCFWRR